MQNADILKLDWHVFANEVRIIRPLAWEIFLPERYWVQFLVYFFFMET